MNPIDFFLALLRSAGLAQDPAQSAPTLPPVEAAQPPLASAHAALLASPFVRDTLAALTGGMPARARTFDPSTSPGTAAFITPGRGAQTVDPALLGIALSNRIGTGQASFGGVESVDARRAQQVLTHEFGHLADLRGLNPELVEQITALRPSAVEGAGLPDADLPHHLKNDREFFATAFAGAIDALRNASRFPQLTDVFLPKPDATGFDAARNLALAELASHPLFAENPLAQALQSRDAAGFSPTSGR